MKLLSKGSTNAKTAKNELLTYIMYLAPYITAGKNVCVKASKGCINVCLFTAGKGSFSNVRESRIAKTKFLFKDRLGFCKQLVGELVKLNSKNKPTAIRLNGTSDLDFVGIIKSQLNFNILDLSNLHYYDYTKIIGKAIKYKDVPNYTITFSRSETNEKDCLTALANGINVAVVFDHTKPFPSTYLGASVLDGDSADDLMLKHSGVILGLKAKGKAKKDTTGFVVR
jgi:hypothetical protein